MSAAKRSRQRQEEAKSAAHQHHHPLHHPHQQQPASKRLKTTDSSHVPASTLSSPSNGLAFLVDRDARGDRKLDARLTNGVPSGRSTRVDESKALVAPDDDDVHDLVGGDENRAIILSSEDEESEIESDDDDGDHDDTPAATTADLVSRGKALANGHVWENEEDGNSVNDKDDELRDDDDDSTAAAAAAAAPDQAPEQLSFGDMLQAAHPDPIDVYASLPNPLLDHHALVPTSTNRALAAPSSASLGTVLTQALKTNDRELLESCFQVTNVDSVRATIQRLPSQHVAALLHRLAERMHKRPGRAGSLMVWVQWSLVAHGGYLASQPDVMRKLKTLSHVVSERARGLQPLLHLKGKLDLLSAQLELRKKMQMESRAMNAGEEEDDDDDEDVVYVEGQDDEDFTGDEDDVDEEDDDEGPAMDENGRLQRRKASSSPTRKPHDHKKLNDLPNGVGHDEDEDEDSAGSEEENEDDEDEDGGAMLDIEAEEASNDESEMDSDEEGDSQVEDSDGSDISDDDDDESDGSVSGVQEPRPQTLSRKR